jgi:hypothetical protein
VSEFVESVTAPDGSRYVVLVVPPGSTLDSDALAPSRLTVFGAAFQSLRGALGSKWRVVVQEQRRSGELGPVLRRRRFSDRSEAERAAATLIRKIGGSGLYR